MRKGMLCQLVVAVLCVGATVSASWAQEDVNAPWDAAKHFEPYWDQVRFSARLYNPVERPDSDPNTQRSLSISGAVRQLDKTGLVGIEDRATNIVVLDQDGFEIHSTVDQPAISRWYRSPDDIHHFVGPFLRNDDIRYSVSIPTDPSLGYPVSLSRVEWSFSVLLADTFEVVDVPFEPNESWIELVDGLEILVEEASAEEGKYSYLIQAIYEPNAVAYSTGGRWHFWRDETPPPVIVVKVEMLDAAGKPVHQPGTSGGFSSGTSRENSDGLEIATTRASGSCAGCGDVATIRYTFALEPYEQEARFVLEDIPVPIF